MQQRPRTAHSQQPQAREQPTPRAARPGPTRHHPGAGAGQLPLAHSPLGSSLRPLGSWVRRDEMRGRVTKDSPWGQRLKGTGTLAPGSAPPDSCHREGREGGPGRTKGVSAAVTAAAGTLDKSQWERGPVLPLRIRESCCRQ